MSVDKKPVVMKGVVVSDLMDKTIVVAVGSFKTHSKYLKKFSSVKRYKVHSPNNSFAMGDTVLFKGCRPISKDKKFVVIEK